MYNVTHVSMDAYFNEILQTRNISRDSPLYEILLHYQKLKLQNATPAVEPEYYDDDDHFKGDVWEYLEISMGPRRGPLKTVIAITVVYSVILLSGVFGNICTCLVIAKNKYMHTATNYYLFNLAVADLLLLVIGLPQETYSIWSAYPWVFGDAFCILRTMLAETSTNASILTITAFTIERYVAICHPMKSQTMSGLKRVVRIIAVIWTLAIATSIPLTVQFKIVYALDKSNNSIHESALCGISEDNHIQLTFELSTFIFFVFPMTLVSVMYTMIAIAIRRSGLHRDGSDMYQRYRLTGVEIRAQQQARARRSVLKMLVAVVVAFFVCWAPFHSQRLMTLYIPPKMWTPGLLKAHKVIYYVSGVCYFISCTINPILYSIMSLKFRQAFKQTLLKLNCCKRQLPVTTRKTYFSYRFSHKNGYSETSFTSMEPGSPARHSKDSKHSSSGGSRSKPGTSKSGSDANSPVNADDGKVPIELLPMTADVDSVAIDDKQIKTEEFVGVYGKYEQFNGGTIQQR